MNVRIWVFGMGLACVAPTPCLAQQESVVNADASAVLGLARAADRQGNPSLARAYYEALDKDPSPNIREEAALARARLSIAESDPRKAAMILRRELDRQPRSLRLRLMLAATLAQLGDPEAARHHLRSAMALPLPPGLASRIGRYSDQLQSDQPFAATISIAMAPDSNINSATTADIVGTVIGDFDLSDDSKAQSGLGLSLEAEVVRRFKPGGKPISIGARGQTSLYRDHDFDDSIVEIFGRAERQLGQGTFSLELTARGQWRGYRTLLHQEGISGRLNQRLGKRTAASIRVDVGAAQVKPNPRQSGHFVTVDGSVQRSVTPTMALAFGPNFSRYHAQDSAYSMTGHGLRFDGWLDVGRASFSLGLSGRWAKADARLAIFPERRRERTSEMQLGLSLRTFPIAAMAPFARLSLTRNRSNIDVYDYRRKRLELGLVRAF